VTFRMVFLHSGFDVSWGSWFFEPTILGGALVVVGLYYWGVFSLPGSVDWRRAALFTAGSLVLFLALVSPLDAAAHHLLSIHMLQHVALTTVGPPLVLLGLPSALLERIFRPKAAMQALRAFANPFAAAALFIVNMWIWHVPYLYEAALNYASVHALMHIAFMGTGLLFWWPAIQPLKGAFDLGLPGRLFYIFVTSFPMAILALLLVSAPDVIYGFYATEERLWGVSAMTDQQVAGVIMGSLGEAASFFAFTILFLKLVNEEEEAAPPPASLWTTPPSHVRTEGGAHEGPDEGQEQHDAGRQAEGARPEVDREAEEGREEIGQPHATEYKLR
jgi:cytochrome c oxidase assembly factor CtaG